MPNNYFILISVFLFFSFFLILFFYILHKKNKHKIKELRAILANIEDGVLVIDIKNNIHFANDILKKIIHVPQNRKVEISDIVSSFSNKFDILGHLKLSLENNTEFISENINYEDSFYKILILPIRNFDLFGKDKKDGGIIIFRNITGDVTAANLRKDFISMLVHELRSPLDGIKKITEVFKNESIDLEEKDKKEYIEMIYKNSSSMLELVSDILDVDKLEAGKFEINKEENDIKKLLIEKITFYEVLAKDANIKLSYFFGENIPSLLSFDKDAIDHVISNLISNAIKYTNKGGEVKVVVFLHQELNNIQQEAEKAGYKSVNKFNEKIVQVLLHEKESFLVVMVSDNGIGIKEEEQNMIFSKFRQLNTKKTLFKKNKSTGLGLVIAKGIINEHKGDIGVISKENEGSTFFFTLPLV